MQYIRLLLFLSFFPIFIIGYFIYKSDKIEKESTRLLMLVFLGGILSSLLTLLLSGLLEIVLPFFTISNEENLNLLELIPYYFIGIALIEEISKWLLVYLFCWRSKEFNYLYDAIVYCVFASLGFAALENIFYVFMGGIGTGVMRGIFSIPGHAFFGVYMGYYLGLSKLTKLNGNINKSRKYFIYSIAAPTILHGIFDYLLGASTRSVLFFPLFLLFIVLLYIFAIKKVKRISKVKLPMKNSNNTCEKCGNKIEGAFCTNCGTKNEI